MLQRLDKRDENIKRMFSDETVFRRFYSSFGWESTVDTYSGIYCSRWILPVFFERYGIFQVSSDYVIFTEWSSTVVFDGWMYLYKLSNTF